MAERMPAPSWPRCADAKSCAIRPSARISRRRRGPASSPTRNRRQVATSAGVGLFSGGTQRTALVIRQPTSAKPVVGPGREAPAAKP